MNRLRAIYHAFDATTPKPDHPVWARIERQNEIDDLLAALAFLACAAVIVGAYAWAVL